MSEDEVDEFRRSRTTVLRDIPVHLLRAGPDVEIDKTLALADALAESRGHRGAVDEIHLAVFTGDRDGDEDGRGLMIPHVFAWGPTREVAIGWERLQTDRVEAVLGAPLSTARIWAARPDCLIELATVARDSGSATSGHLSFRWLLGNEIAAAEALSASRIALDHVSLHATPEEETLIAEILTGLGMVEVKRPERIEAAGRWLQCGDVRIHLNSRSGSPGETTFPGTAPNHICLRVGDTDEIEESLKARGIATVRAGTLHEQLWWRLAGGTTIEFQQGDSVPEELHLI